MRFNEEEVRKCYKFLAHEKETEIRLICPKRKNPPKSIFVNSEEEFVKSCKDFNEKYNIYAGINERKPNGTEKKDVISVKTIVLDIDAIRARGFEKQPAKDSELKECEKDVDEIIASMIDAGCEPPTKIYSGNGYQIWIAIPKVEISDSNRDPFQSKLQGFQDLIKKKYENYGGIDKIGDLPRIIKIWGTWNIKGDNTKGRPHRLCKILLNGERTNDDKLLQQIKRIKSSDLDASINILPIEELNKAFIPKPFEYLFYEYKQKDGKNWMRIIETLSSFLRGIGLSNEKSLSHLIEWSRRQPYRETNEEQEIQRINDRIFRNGINCPNFEKMIKRETGYPFFGLKDVFNGVELGKDWEKYKNPVKYYKVMVDRGNLDRLGRVIFDVKSYILCRDEDKATEVVCKDILQNNHIYTTQDDIKSEIWFYDGGIYVPNGKSKIKEIARTMYEETYTPQRVNKVIAKIEADTQIEADDFFRDGLIDEIPVQNGILNIFTKELFPFTPEKIFFNKLPINYDKGATCPSIRKFFSDVLKDDSDVQVMIEFIGFCLMKEYRFEKSVMLIGNGRNGKGKTLSLIKYFLGAKNCCSIPLSQITPASTSVCELYGRLANLAGDLSNTDLKDTGMFKQITGRDLITAKRKYLRDIFFVNYAKIVFACNELPKVYDLSDGFWSRWILFEFPYKFMKEQFYNKLDKKEKEMCKIMDESIIDKITTPEELSGLLNDALDSLHHIVENKGFSYSQGTNEIKELWIRKSDSFTAFCIDTLVGDYNHSVTKKDLRKEYNFYCKRNKLPGCSDKAIKATLEDRYGAVEHQELGGNRVWEGIKFGKIVK